MEATELAFSKNDHRGTGEHASWLSGHKYKTALVPHSSQVCVCHLSLHYNISHWLCPEIRTNSSSYSYKTALFYVFVVWQIVNFRFVVMFDRSVIFCLQVGGWFV